MLNVMPTKAAPRASLPAARSVKGDVVDFPGAEQELLTMIGSVIESATDEFTQKVFSAVIEVEGSGLSNELMKKTIVDALETFSYETHMAAIKAQGSIRSLRK